MRLLSLFLPLVLASGVAQADTPARLSGIWQLQQSTTGARPSGFNAPPAARLFVSGGTLWGSYGCGTFRGTVDAAANGARILAAVLPPAPNERCLYAAADLPFVRDLNAATRYVVSRDHLVLFSGTARLVFSRIGFVTPAKP